MFLSTNYAKWREFRWEEVGNSGLGDAGGPRRLNWQATQPAPIRSGDFCWLLCSSLPFHYDKKKRQNPQSQKEKSKPERNPI